MKAGRDVSIHAVCAAYSLCLEILCTIARTEPDTCVMTLCASLLCRVDGAHADRDGGDVVSLGSSNVHNTKTRGFFRAGFRYDRRKYSE
jgi:hypothetical protein